MATNQEIQKELIKALLEIGRIKPWFDEEVNEWIFESPLYPVECGGSSPEDVIERYPLYLKEFIKERMKGNLNILTEKSTKGRGGFRPGSGRPKGAAGAVKEKKERIYVPPNVAKWYRNSDNALQDILKIMHKR